MMLRVLCHTVTLAPRYRTLHLALVNNLWVYGILRVLSWPMRVAFMSVNLLLGVGMFYVGKALDNAVWGELAAGAAGVAGLDTLYGTLFYMLWYVSVHDRNRYVSNRHATRS